MTGGQKTDNGRTDDRSYCWPAGSALILVVVLTSILAIVGVLFVISSRVDALSTTSIMQERDLDAAIETLVTKLADELVLDTSGITDAEYYDYPGEEDEWLACLEPYDDGSYKWGQITDLTGYISRDIPGVKNSWDTQKIEPRVIPENEVIRLDENGIIKDEDSSNDGQRADADGDGVADAKWIELEDTSSSTGRAVYAAIRVIDNGGMLNVNTAYLFDPNAAGVEASDIDGSSQLQVNLATLSERSKDAKNTPEYLHGRRCGMEDPNLNDYRDNVIRRYGSPDGQYTPFDISDELELRYRYLINQTDIDTRIEEVWDKCFQTGLQTPVNSTLSSSKWFERASYVTTAEPNLYSYRHLATIHNADRIISPAMPNDVNVANNGLAEMLNINLDPNKLNDANDNYDVIDSWEKAKDIYQTFAQSMDPNLSRTTRQRMKREYAQLAVNMVDLRDEDMLVTTLSLPDVDTGPYKDSDFTGNEFVYGLEPYPVITQVAIRIDPNDPCSNSNYYGVELFNPFDHDIWLDKVGSEFELLVTDVNANYDPCDPNTFGATVLAEIPLIGTLQRRIGGGDFHVVYNRLWGPFNATGSFQQDGRLILSSGYKVERDPMGGDPIIDPNIVNSHNVVIRRTITKRYDETRTQGNQYIYPERQLIYQSWVRWDPNSETHFYGRKFRLKGPPDPKWWDVVYPLTEEQSIADANSDPCNIGSFRLGANDYDTYPPDPCDRPAFDIALPYGNFEDEDDNRDLVTVGDIARIWSIGPGDVLYDPNDANSFAQSEIFDVNEFEFDPCDPNMQNLRLENFQSYKRTVGETLRYVSWAIERSRNNCRDEDLIRLNLGDPHYANLFNYITVFDPRVDGVNNDGKNGTDDNKELKIHGRININTAPRFVLEQLPWMTADIAEAIVAYRDKQNITSGPDYLNRYSEIEGELDRCFSERDLEYILDKPGFGSIGELNLVIGSSNNHSIRTYGLRPGPGSGFPDLTDAYGLYDDGADNDFEERDLIFARISNLVTVRSDVFTAYILVRLGIDGPQKRVIAILDRSDVYNGADKVKIIALHPVPDAR